VKGRAQRRRQAKGLLGGLPPRMGADLGRPTIFLRRYCASAGRVERWSLARARRAAKPLAASLDRPRAFALVEPGRAQVAR
jgi:hypothetical protein